MGKVVAGWISVRSREARWRHWSSYVVVEMGERRGGGMDGDVGQWYRASVKCRWGCVS